MIVPVAELIVSPAGDALNVPPVYPPVPVSVTARVPAVVHHGDPA